MKRISRSFRKGCNRLLTGLLSVVGLFVSCGDSYDEKEIRLEYGTPYSEFSVKGKVTDQQGKPVKGIMVHSQSIRPSNGYTFPDTTYTNQEGEYLLRSFAFDIRHIDIKAEDIDGPANGSFQPDSARIKGEDIKFKDGDGRWFMGKDEKEINFTLKEATENEE